MNKYNNKKTIVDGITFDSKKEARRYLELKRLEASGQIEELRLQVPFELVPVQREPDTIGPKGGIKKGKVIEQACTYKADFVYYDAVNDRSVVEDTKGKRTPDYIIKRKLMLWRYGIRIREI